MADINDLIVDLEERLECMKKSEKPMDDIDYAIGIDYGYELCINRVKAWLEKQIPAADVRPVVRGRWLSKEYMYGDPDVGIEDMWIDRLAEQSDYYAYCSICSKDAGYTEEGSLILSDYCPNCGARMDGGDKA